MTTTPTVLTRETTTSFFSKLQIGKKAKSFLEFNFLLFSAQISVYNILDYSRNGEGSSAQNSSARKICSTPFEQMTKIYETAQKSKKYAVRVPRVNFEQMQVLDQNEQLLKLLLLDKRLKKCQLLDNIFSKENGVHVRQIS
jgi:hypothetical protein